MSDQKSNTSPSKLLQFFWTIIPVIIGLFIMILVSMSYLSMSGEDDMKVRISIIAIIDISIVISIFRMYFLIFSGKSITHPGYIKFLCIFWWVIGLLWGFFTLFSFFI